MRYLHLRFLLTLAALVGGALTPLFAQTTYHLHDDSGTLQLKTAGPDTAAVALSSQDIKNLNPGEFVIQQFPTASGVPGTAGLIPSGSTVTFNLWMKVTSTHVSSFPRAKLFLDSTGGTQLCTKTGTTALTTTLTKYVLSCTTSGNITLTASDTFLLWVGFNTSTKTTSSLVGQLEVEGNTTQYDGTVVVPAIIPPPSISNLSATSGTPGTSVVITGSNFGSPQGSSTVTFNGTSASVSSWAVGSITATVPSATTGNIIVTVNGQASNSVPFTIPAPTITSLSPISGRYGTSVTITGSNFGATQAAGSSTVKFGTTTGTPTSWSNTGIAVPVPSGAAGGTLSVTVTVGVQSASSNFVVIPPPNITSLSPTSGPINTSVTVSGSGFGSPQGTSTITFNTTATVPFSWGDSSIIVPVPAGATTGSVTVNAGGQTSNSLTFTVTGGPSISGINPTSGSAGTGVTISGSNFGGAQGSSVVKFNGLAAKVTSWASGSIGVNAPPGVSTGPVNVTVSGQTSNSVTFTAITTATLSGTVSNTSSVGISGATVQALQNGVSKASTTTTSNGSYTISSLPAGNYDLQASASSYGTALQNSIAVPANQTTTQNFTLSTPGGISGKVTQSDGLTAISGASVQAYVGSAMASSATSDSGGNYSISGLNAAAYRVQASANGYVAKSQTASVTGGSNATANFSLQAPGTAAIQYVYDELGRLAGVIDTGGDVATYQYDAVGNILSISRQGSSQVSIVSFTPRTGTSGTTVTINGTGFSTTPSQNTVQFNTTAATVTTATATQIVTSVPSGATTGPITVTTPSGSAISSTNFTVGTVNGAPTITSFSPGMGTAGQTISITGTNFDPAVANDRVVINASRALTNSVVNTTQVNTTFPSSTASGRIAVSTPTGTATSTQDFYTPFLSHVTGDIGWTGRASLGGSQTVSLATGGKIGLLLFDGVWGQGVSLHLSGSTLSSCTLYIFAPDKTQITFNNNSQLSSDCTSATTLVSSIPLLMNGTYTIGIEAGSTSSGSVTVSLMADSSSSILIDGPPVTVTTSTASQDARLPFNAIAGQRIVVYATNVTNPAASVYLLKPDGTIQNSGGLFITNNPSGQTFFLDTQTLAKTGSYQLWVFHSGTNVGSETLQIASVPPDASGTLTVPAAGATGPTSAITTTRAGQNGSLTFSGTTGQQLSLNDTNNTYASGQCNWFLYDPNNLQIQSSQCGLPAFVDTFTLTKTGTYTLFVNPTGTATGGITWSINNDADVTGSISIDGSAVTTSTTVAGQDSRLNFSATSGQRIVVYATNVSNPAANLYLVKPDGTNQATVYINNSPTGQTFFIDTQTLVAGTNQLWVHHSGTNFGSETLQISSVPADVSGSVTIGGSAYSFTTVVGQNANVTFSNPTSQTATVHWTSGTYSSSFGCILTVTGPNNFNSSTNCNSATGSLNLGTIAPGPPLYNIFVNPSAQSTGGLSLTVTHP